MPSTDPTWTRAALPCVKLTPCMHGRWRMPCVGDHTWLPLQNRCSLPKKSGPCLAAFIRYFHNSLTGQCEDFIWGGCQPNANNFATLEDCEAACPPVDTCDLPKKVGPCLAAFPRYFFNSESGECESFIWGGCQPNANNFVSLEECERACPAVDDCRLPVKVGPGKAAIPRYFFSTETGQCERFLWGGAQPNGNNFETRKACEAACEPADVCTLPLVSGECLAFFEVWGYSEAQGKCVEFVYGGCGGNGNRFDTEEECIKACG